MCVICKLINFLNKEDIMNKIKILTVLMAFCALGQSILGQERKERPVRKNPLFQRKAVCAVQSLALSSEEVSLSQVKFFYKRSRNKCMKNIFDDAVSRDAVYTQENRALEKLALYIVGDDRTNYTNFLKTIEPGYQDFLKAKIKEKVFIVSNDKIIPHNCFITEEDSLVQAYEKLRTMKSSCTLNI